MRVFLRFTGVFALAVLFGVPSARSDDAVELRWRLRKGEVQKYVFKHHEMRTTELGDQKLTTTTDTEFDMQWTVREVDDKGTATVGLKLTAIRVTSGGKEFEFQYDSARGNATDDEYKKKLVQFFDQVRFADYELKIPPTGRPLRVLGFDKLLMEISPEQNIADYYALNLHDATFGWFLGQVLGPIPGAAVKPGQKWDVPIDAKLADFGQLSGRAQGLFGQSTKVGETPCQEIRVQGEQTLDVDMKWLNTPLRGPLKTTKMEGRILFDPKHGRVQSGEAALNLHGDFKFGAGDNAGALKVTYEHTLDLVAK